ncbi:multicopper oxidase family protein [Allosphingosinicella sp.]|jgi:FtsP/CotA-like multicopper oxidase with cupredoxin domain|uniref:multicopper oxidase family protein n=1 Tax=Allosphingosinicella sp. TaxID=2823234 RepID=UPI002F1DF94D
MRFAVTRTFAVAVAALVSSDVSPATPPSGVVSQNLEIAFVRGAIYNPWTGRNDPVELRSFRGRGTADGDFVAPTIRVAPGQTLRVALDNRLPRCSETQVRAGRCFNDTNIHTHGLWVSPAGNSDNVLVSIAPGQGFQYEYAIPEDHPAGTFWYHPHRHGSGYVQVGSGMAGALIVTGDRVPTAERPGDIDILLRNRRGPFDERILLFQQIQYACLDASGAIADRRENDMYVRPWTCRPDQSGRVESPDHDEDWRFSGRFTGINGRIQPRLEGARAGRFERWRLIHAGTREPVHMRLFRLADGAPDLGSVRGEDQAAWVARHCRGEPLTVWPIALDGLTRSDVQRADEAVLFPGDRMDVLTYFPEPGRYCVIQDTARRGPGGPDPWRRGGEHDPSRALAILDVAAGDPAVADPSALLQSQMIAAAERALPGPSNSVARQRVTSDLRNGMRLGAFVWHPEIRQAEVTGYRETILNILEPPVTNGQLLFHVNGRPYEHGRIDQMLPLGGVEEWHVRSFVGGHPMHIHVNPFQIVSIVDAQGRNVADPESPVFDPDYAGLIGQWKDTVFVKEGHVVVFRTRYERFVGDFVIHCHILFHGDHGMMQNLRIYMPESPGATVSHH